MSLRQVIAAWPVCAAVLERYPLARWGGRWSLQELGPFARDVGIDESRLLRELGEVAAVPVIPSIKPPTDASPLPLIFVAIGVGWTLGGGWGVGIVLRIAYGADFAAVPATSIHVQGPGSTPRMARPLCFRGGITNEYPSRLASRAKE
jgi:hypothetical protein